MMLLVNRNSLKRILFKHAPMGGAAQKLASLCE